MRLVPMTTRRWMVAVAIVGLHHVEPDPPEAESCFLCAWDEP